MDIHQKLNIFRKIYCLGDQDIKNIFGKDKYEDYLKYKYEDARKSFGEYGNFHLMFQLDEENAKKFLDYVGFKDLENTVKFINDLK